MASAVFHGYSIIPDYVLSINKWRTIIEETINMVYLEMCSNLGRIYFL